MRLPFLLVRLLLLCFFLSACNQAEPVLEPEPGHLLLTYSPLSALVELSESDGAKKQAPYAPVNRVKEGEGYSASYSLEPAAYTINVSAEGYKAQKLERKIEAGQTVTADVRLEPISQPTTDPVALFSATPQTGDAPLKVALNASDSVSKDSELASYSWDFGDGAKSEGLSSSHVYTESGEFTVTLKVTDEQGKEASSSKRITVNAPPSASFMATPPSGSAPLSVTFDASASVDSDGKLMSYRWDFGDGTTGEGAQTSHVFAVSGAYEVHLSVVDDKGSTHSATEFIYVDTVPPQPAFSYSPDVATAPAELTFSAGASQAGSHEVVTYMWDFGDGTTATGETVKHTFVAHGEYTVTLTIEDSKGVPAHLRKLVKVNGAPVAKFSQSVRSGEVPLKVRLDASQSSDPESDLDRYEWTLGDVTATGRILEHTFTKVGSYVIELTVIDGAGAKASSKGQITVENTPPVASFEITSTEGFAPFELSVDASESSDANDAIESYKWNFGDGSVASGKTAMHRYTSSGTHEVTLTVQDSYGAKASVKKQVTVKNRPPKAEFVTLKTVGVAPLTINFDAGASSDTDGNIDDYAWDFGTGEDTQGEKVSYTFTRPGSYSVELEVTDNLGATSVSTQTITVLESGGLEPLSVSANGRHLIKDGEPFFWLGDTAWSIWTTLKHDDVIYYLDDAKAKGFNVVQVFLTTIWSKNGSNAENEFGEPPFIDNDPTQLNPAYFDFVEWVIERASERGLYTAIAFGELGRIFDSRLPYRIADNQEGYDYANALGQRLRRQTLENKIIWMGGQDVSGNRGFGPEMWTAMIEGLTDGVNGVNKFDDNADYSSTFATHHPQGCCSSSKWFHNEAWLDFDGINTWKNYWNIVTLVKKDYSLSTKPTVCLENSYEGHFFDGELRTDWHARFQGYWCALSGTTGYGYGHKPGYELGRESDRDWKGLLQSPGRLDMLHLREAISSYSMEKRIPDQTMIVSDAGTADYAKTYIAAARADDGSYALIYSTQGISFDLDLSKLSGSQFQAQWFDPREGTYTPIGNVTKGSSVSFDPPGSPGEGNDWLLVLDAID